MHLLVIEDERALCETIVRSLRRQAYSVDCCYDGEKAVELLGKTDDKTYVIAAKVGYQEQNYFSYVFKKRFGVSPTKFRGAK